MALRLIPPKAAGWAICTCKRTLHEPLLAAVTTALDKENEGLNKAFTKEDFMEAMTARMEKRPPVFKGK